MVAECGFSRLFFHWVLKNGYLQTPRGDVQALLRVLSHLQETHISALRFKKAVFLEKLAI